MTQQKNISVIENDLQAENRSIGLQTSSGSGRLLYADLIRVVAAFSVVVMHTIMPIWDAAPPASSAWQVANVFRALGCFCVPVFVMVSGMFFLDPDKPMPIRKIYRKYIFRIAVIYYFWSLVYAVFRCVVYYGKIDLMVLERIFRIAVRGHHTLWFLIMLVGLYIITPLLRVITQHASRRLLELFLLLSFLFAGCLPTVLNACGEGVVKQLGDYYLSNLNLHFVLGFTGYYIAGYYFKTYSLSKRKQQVLYAAGLAGVAATIGLTAWESVNTGQTFSLLYEQLAPNIMLMGAAVFVLIKEHSSRVCSHPKAGKIIRQLSSCTLGIYLVHDLINRIFAACGWDILHYPPLLIIPLYTLAVFFISFGIVFLLKKIPVVNQYLV